MQFDLTATSTARHSDIQTAINAASGQLPKNLPSPPTYRKVNPADAPILILAVTLRPGAADRRSTITPRTSWRSRSQPDFRRRAGQHRRPAKAGGAHPGRPGKARLARPHARGCPRRDRQCHDRSARRATIDGSDADLHDLRQRPDAERGSRGTTSSSPISNGAPSADPRHRPRHRRTGKHPAGGLGERQAGDPAVRFSSSPAPTSSRRWTASRRAAAAAGGDPADRSRSSVLSDRTQTIRASVDDVQFTLMLTIALVVMVIFLFLRSLWATHDPERHRAAGADRHLRRDVRARLQPRQSVADGADDRGRLRRRRRDRHAGEHRPPHRGRA